MVSSEGSVCVFGSMEYGGRGISCWRTHNLNVPFNDDRGLKDTFCFCVFTIYLTIFFFMIGWI